MEKVKNKELEIEKEPKFWSTLFSFIWKADKEEEDAYEGISKANERLLKRSLEVVDNDIMKSAIDVSTTQRSGRMSQLKANVKGTKKTSKARSKSLNEVQKDKNEEMDRSRE